jgi:chromate transporter
MTNRALDFKLLMQIFTTFLKISPVTFGGGYAMIPLIEKEVVEHRKWLKTKDLTDVFALAESVPGAIAINSATFIGFRLAGIPGAVAALLGTLLPTFMIVLLLSMIYIQVKDHPKIEAAFIAIRVTVAALITYAAIQIGKTAVVDVTTAVIVGATVVVMWFLSIHPILIIIGGGCIGIVIMAIKQKLVRGSGVDQSNKDGQEQSMVYKYKDYYFGDGI